MTGRFKIERGDIFYVTKAPVSTGSEQIAGRPGIVVSNDENNAHSTTIEVVCEQITTVSVDRLGDYIGKCNTEEMNNIDRCLLASMGLSSCYAQGVPHKEIESLVERDLYKKMYEIAVSKLANISTQIGMIERNGKI